MKHDTRNVDRSIGTTHETRYTIHVILCFILTLFGCEKASFTDNIGDPVFSVNFSIDGQPQTITAGAPVNQYLYTDFKQDKDVRLSTADFGETSCQNSCIPQLRFEFRQYVTGASTIRPDTIRPIENLPFYTFQPVPATSNYLLNVGVLGNVYKNLLWTIETGRAIDSPVLSYTFADTTVRQIAVRGTTNDGLISSATIPISFDTFAPAPLRAVIRLQQISPERRQASVLLSPILTPQQLPGIKWANGSNDFTFSDINRSSYAVTLTNNKGQQATASLDNVQNLTAPIQSIEVDVALKRAPTPNIQQSNNVAIQWKDTSGKLWRSDRRMQPNDRFFRIISARPYQDNEKGQKTQLLNIAFSCTLFDVNGNSKKIEGRGTIAVARP